MTNNSTKRPESFSDSIIGWVGAFLVGGLLLMWYNYIWIQYSIPYWKFVCLSIPMFVCFKLVKWTKYIWASLLAVALMAQTLAWLKIITLPLIR